MANVLTATHCIADINDPLNFEKSRSFEETSVFDYNCMGFAFKTFSWMHPRIDSDFIEYLFGERSCDNTEENFDEYDEDNIEYFTIDEIDNIEFETMQDVIDYNNEFNEFIDNDIAISEVYNWGNYHTDISLAISVRNILNVIPNVRKITSFNELNEDEYGVAFAACKSDFHFGVYVPTFRAYCHKMGGRDPQTAKDLNDIFSNKYQSKRFYFAVKGSFDDIYLDVLTQEMEWEKEK